jgi:hypothetical protein
MKLLLFTGALLCSAACIDAAQEEVSIPLAVAGRSAAKAFETKRGFAIALDEAKLAFGPLYLCAGATAGSLCETASVEWTDAALVDLLRDSPTRVGELSGLSGRVRSFMYDLGLTSLLTESRPLVLDAARKLSGNSLRLVGRVDVDGTNIPFRALLALQQTEETEQGTPVVRSGEGDDLAHDLQAGDELSVRFDARDWFQTANFGLWLEQRSCEPAGPAVVCNGQIELSCGDDGAIEDSRACADRGEVCIAGQGCVERVVVDASSQVGAAIRFGLTSASAPEFRWSR